MAMQLDLRDKRVLVSGGTRGIGLAIVERFLQQGAVVAFCARSTQTVVATVQMLRNQTVSETDNRVRGWSLDIQQAQAVTQWVHSAAEFLGGIDIVIANAGAMATDDSDESWLCNWAVDIAGLRHLLAAATPYLERAAAASGDAAVIAIASTSAGTASRVSPYGPVKAALVHYVKALAKQLAPLRIRANTVSPGPTFVEDGFWADMAKNNPDQFNTTVASFPKQQMIKPQDVANIVAFLASPYATAIAGSNIIVDCARSTHIHL